MEAIGEVFSKWSVYRNAQQFKTTSNNLSDERIRRPYGVPLSHRLTSAISHDRRSSGDKTITNRRINVYSPFNSAKAIEL